MSTRKKKAPTPPAPQPRRAQGDHLAFGGHAFAQGKQQMYLISMPAKTLWTVVKINQRLEDKDEGYQRALSSARVNSIARYLEQGNAIPGAILVSFDKATWSDQKSQLVIENTPDAGWVIDGQHRLAGAHKATVDIDVPVVCFIGLSLEQQIEFFVTINREQKGVPSSLYYDLLSSLPRRRNEAEMVQERSNDLASALRQNENSPFYLRIVVTTSPKQGQLSNTNVIRKLSPLIRRDGRLGLLDDEQRAAILNNLYLALEQVFPKEYERADSVFFRTIGFGALMNTLPLIMDVTFQLAGELNFRVAAVAKTLRLIDDFEFDSWRQMGTGSAAELQAADDLRTRLQDEVKRTEKPGLRL